MTIDLVWDHLWCRSGCLAGLPPQSWRRCSDTLQTQRPLLQSGPPPSMESTNIRLNKPPLSTLWKTPTFIRFGLITSATDGRSPVFHGLTKKTIRVSEPDRLPISNLLGQHWSSISVNFSYRWEALSVCVCERLYCECVVKGPYNKRFKILCTLCLN